MTIANANNMAMANANSIPLRAADPYAPQFGRASDMQAPSPRTQLWNEKPLQPFEMQESAPSQNAEMFGSPYSLELGGNGRSILPLPYRPTQPLQSPQSARPEASAHVPVQPAQHAAPPENKLPGTATPDDEQNNGEGAKTMEEIHDETHCSACESRRYQDGSNDPGVSFKFATKLNSYSATAAVRAHEYQHVRHHQMQADRQDRKIISQTVMLRTRRCPECGKMYTAGGTTKTVTAAYREQADAGKAGEGQKLNACV